MPGPDGPLLAVLENLPDAVTVSQAVRDDSGRAVDMRLQFMNAVARSGQAGADEAIGRLCSELWPGMLTNGTFDACMRVLDTGTPASGAFQWTDEASYRPAGYDYKAVRVGADTLVWVLRDNTETLRAHWDLAASEERYRTVLAALDEGIVVRDKELCVLAANAAAERMLASFGRRALGPAWRVSPVDTNGRAVAEPDLPDARALATGTPQVGVVLGLPGPGGMRWFSANSHPLFRPKDPEPYGVVTSFVDVTERRLHEDELARRAFYDALTGLANRALLLDRVEQALARQRRRTDGRVVALLFVDLDDFKSINDCFGHAVGDHVLLAVAERLAESIRSADTAARMGGDEFVVLLDAVSEAELAHIERRVQDRLERPTAIQWRGGERQLAGGASVGHAVAAPGTTPGELLEEADTRMYEAKRSRQGGAPRRRSAEEILLPRQAVDAGT